MILNTIDGIDSKTSEIMVCLTTNHVNKLNRAMMRPGRLDAVIEIERPDAESVARLCRNYCGALLDADEDLDEPAAILAGQTAAVVREVCERSKMGAIARTGKADSVSASDLATSANGMRAQLDLMDAKPPYEPSDMAKAAAVLRGGHASVMGLRGGCEILKKPWGDVKVAYTLHPAFVLRSPKWRPVFQNEPRMIRFAVFDAFSGHPLSNLRKKSRRE